MNIKTKPKNKKKLDISEAKITFAIASKNYNSLNPYSPISTDIRWQEFIEICARIWERNMENPGE